MNRFVGLLLVLCAIQLPAQDLQHYKRVVKELSSAKYQGRGYARGGANKAGKYLENAVFDSYEPVFRLITDFVENY